MIPYPHGRDKHAEVLLRKDRARQTGNAEIWDHVKVGGMALKLRQTRLRCPGHVEKREEHYVGGKIEVAFGKVEKGAYCSS